MEGDADEDVEDQLDNFFIRKPVSGPLPRSKTVNTKDRKVHDNIPLLLSDILRSTEDAQEKVFTITKNNGKIWNFRSCLVYAFVAGRGVHNKSYHKYIIDDGTGSMEVSIAVKPSKRMIIASLHNEVTSSTARNQDDEQLSGSMIRLLGRAMEYLDGSAIAPGHNIFLQARPNFFRGKIGLDAFSFCLDRARSRKLEIAFADHLMDWYKD